MIMHKYNIMNKKWVGLFLTLFLSINIIVKDSNVYAEAEKQGYCSGASAKFSMNSSSDGEKLKNVEVDLGKGKYSIWLVPENVIDESDLSDSSNTKLKKIADKALTRPGVKKITSGATSRFVIKHQDVKQSPFTVNNNSDFYVIVSLEVEEPNADCGYWLKIEHVTHDNQISTAAIDKTLANKEACDWATSFVNTVDSRMATLVRKAMAPCFGGSSYNMSKENLNKIKKSLEDFYNNTYKRFASSTTGDGSYTAFSKDLPALDEKWKEIKDTKKVDYKALGANSTSMLTCSTKNEKTYQYLYHVETKDVNADITLGDDIVAKKNTTSKKVCGTKCRETLTVSYGPPVSVIAGQCFTYEVEVKSNVECVVTGLGGDGSGGNGDDAFNNFPDINNYIPCEVYPYCYGSNGVPAGGPGYTTQAGPSEDFDSCVSSCDGGKYSQKCIDSCYNSVYSKKTREKTTSSNKSTTKKTSSLDINTSDENNSYEDLVKSSGLTIDEINRKIYSIDTITLATRMGLLSGGSVGGSSCPGGDPLADSSVISKVYEYVNDNITGNYYMNGRTISYRSKGSCEWNKYGYYYFRDKSITARTVCNAYGYSWYWGSTTCSSVPYSSCRSSNGCYRGRTGGGSGHYYPDSNGFKRSTVCQESCEWINSGKSYTGGSCYYLDKEKAETDYVNNVNNYINALTKCIEAVVANCNTETTNFTIAVNNDVESGTEKQKCDSGNYDSNGNCIRKDDNNQENMFIDNTQLEFNRILKYNGGTCSSGFNNSGNGTKVDMYHSIITFPGAWINNKNGEVIYDKPEGSNSKWYTSKIGNYCTPLTAKNVNAHWWTWYQYYKAGTTNKTFDEWAGRKAKDITYNIFAKIADFGKYNWDLNAGCFYSVNDYTPTCEGESCNPGTTVCEFAEGCDDIPNKCVGDSCDPCTGDSCEPSRKTPSDNYTTKSISPKTMFPQTKTSSLSTEKVSPTRLSYADKMADAADGRRAEGFNWSVNATNLSIAGYPVTPSSLVKKIENSNVYDESEVDYEINLTKEQIRKIKSEAKDSNFSYTSYSDGKFKEIKGDSTKYLAVVNSDSTKKYTENTIPSFKYYKSDYIRSHGATKYPSNNGLSCNNIASGGNDCDITLGGRTNSDDDLISFLTSAQSIR